MIILTADFLKINNVTIPRRDLYVVPITGGLLNFKSFNDKNFNYLTNVSKNQGVIQYVTPVSYPGTVASSLDCNVNTIEKIASFLNLYAENEDFFEVLIRFYKSTDAGSSNMPNIVIKPKMFIDIDSPTYLFNTDYSPFYYELILSFATDSSNNNFNTFTTIKGQAVGEYRGVDGVTGNLPKTYILGQSNNGYGLIKNIGVKPFFVFNTTTIYDYKISGYILLKIYTYTNI